MTGRINRQIRRSVLGLSGDGRERLRRLLAQSTLELPPTPEVIADVSSRLVPGSARLAVATTVESGIEATIAASCELAARGFDVTPHLAARSVRDESHLAWMISQMKSAWISSVLVVGGDGDRTGNFAAASDLIPPLRQAGLRIGIAGYPEGHPLLGTDELTGLLLTKAPDAGFIVTQPCLEADRVLRWAAELRLRGCDVPIEVSVVGVVGRYELWEVADDVRLGHYRQALFRGSSVYHASGFLSGLVAPDRFDQLDIAAMRITTLGDVDSAESWRQQLYDASGDRQAV